MLVLLVMVDSKSISQPVIAPLCEDGWREPLLILVLTGLHVQVCAWRWTVWQEEQAILQTWRA